MEFLVSTSQHILLVDTYEQAVYLIHSGKGLYYGLCLHDSRVVAACRNRLPGADDGERMNERGSLLFFDEGLSIKTEVLAPFPLRDLHGIASLDYRVWVTCAFDNFVAIFDPATEDWQKWYPDPLARDRDVHHFNTIAEFGGQVGLLAHNWGESQIFFFNYPSLDLDVVRPLGVQAHNIFWIDSCLATCSSAEGRLVAESGWEVRTGGFPRGFAAADGIQLVGISLNVPRESRNVADGLVRVFDINWQFQADYLLQGVGMILDILPVRTNARALGPKRWSRCEIHEDEPVDLA